MTEVENKKCSIVSNGLVACPSLSRWVDGKVVRVQQVFNRDMKQFGEVVILHSGTGQKKKQGVILNFCPFCGEPVFDEQISSGQQEGE